MTEATFDTFSATAKPPATPPAPALGKPASRLQEYIRAGKFSPAVAAQLESVINSDGAQPLAISPVAPQSEFYVAEMTRNLAIACIFAAFVLGAIGLCVSFAGFTEDYLMIVAALIFVFVMLAVVAVGSLNQAPHKPRPPKPVKDATPAKGDAQADSPAQAAQ